MVTVPAFMEVDLSRSSSRRMKCSASPRLSISLSPLSVGELSVADEWRNKVEIKGKQIKDRNPVNIPQCRAELSFTSFISPSPTPTFSSSFHTFPVSLTLSVCLYLSLSPPSILSCWHVYRILLFFFFCQFLTY